MTENKPEAVIRLEKLQALQKAGINPYPANVPEFEALTDVLKKKEGSVVATVGRISSIRSHGKTAFLDLKSGEEKLQLLATADLPNFEQLGLYDVGDYLWVKGELFRTKTEEFTIRLAEISLLSKALLPVPEGWHGLTDTETRYRQRALDFKVNPEARAIMRTRSQVITGIRAFLDRHGFIELQTPVLQPIPGGATAKPFSTHYNALDADFYLRISDELYLKRLVVGGFERVYEIGPDFRNEGLSHMHNPEFTMCEFYWAYQNYQGLMKVTEKLVQELVQKTHGSLKITYQKQPIDFTGSFTVVAYADLIKQEAGIDIAKEATFEQLSTAVKEKNITFEGQKISVWSELVDELFKKVCRPKIVQPTFVIDYPVATAPLAKKSAQNPNIAEKFQLILAGGYELINAYTELNDPIDQEDRFKQQVKMRDAGWDEAQMLDENYIEALKYGMPPTAGWGMGIDRLVMILTDQHSIKEVIPFPTLRPEHKPNKSA